MVGYRPIMTRPRRSILVVEDDSDLREFFRFALTSAGFEVRVAMDGWQALQRLDAQVPDVIVLDLLLPGLTGEAVLSELIGQAETRNIPVVVVTGTHLTPNVANVVCVLRKPVTADTLISVIDKCLSSGSSSARA
jgi:CheY-like chemotaxis protein